MFLGVSTLSLDSKGRLAVPAKYRALLRDSGAYVYVTISPHEEPCLLMYPQGEWLPLAEKLSRLPSMEKKVRQMQRRLLGHALELEMDGQGRILLSNELRAFAHLDKQVCLVGQGKKFEIWDESRWLSERDDSVADPNLSDSAASAELNSLSF